MPAILNDAEKLLEKIKPDLLKAFSSIPDYGTLGLNIHFQEKEAVRVEWSGSISRRLLGKEVRGQI